MYHVIAATTNPAKINAIKLAFEQVFGKDTFDIEDINVDGRVPQQPIEIQKRELAHASNV